MDIRTKDPNQLIACLHRLMVDCSDEVRKQAANYADCLEQLPQSEEVIMRAQLLLDRHNVKCPDADDDEWT